MNIKKFLSANHSFSREEELLEYKIKTLVLVALITAVTVLIMGIVRYLQSNYIQAIADAIFIIVIVFSYLNLCRSKNNYTAVSRILLLFGMTVVLLVMHSAIGSEARLLWVAIVVIMMFFLRDKREGLIMATAFTTVITILYLFDPNIFHLSFTDFFILIINIVLISAAILWYEKIKESREDKLIISKKRLEQMVKERTLELEESRNNAELAYKAKSDFLSNMSHELLTPLNSIIGMSYILLQDTHEQKYHKNIQKVYDSATLLLGLINDILDISKIESNHFDMNPMPFNIKEVKDYLFNNLKPKADKKNINMIFKIDDNIEEDFFCDSIRVKQVLVNLLDNAIKFSKNGSSVVFGIDLEKDDKERGCLHFYIKDNGIGMSEKVQKSLFQPFIQADMSTARKYGGIGLGLAISKRLVEMMNGTIWVQSEPGIGSTFHVNICFKKHANNIKNIKDDAVSVKELHVVQNLYDELDKQKFLEISTDLKKHLEDSDTNAVKIFESLKQISGMGIYSNQLDILGNIIDNYEFDEAIELLNRLIESVEKGI